MKLYIWTGFCPDWSDGLAFAVAESEEQAKNAVAEYVGTDPNDWGELEVRPLNEPVARAVYGGS